MCATGRFLVVVCAIIGTLSCFATGATTVGNRPRRAVVPGNAASRPSKDTIRKSQCRVDIHCKHLPRTSCDYDPVDGKPRCLCADRTHPINDYCILKPQEIGMTCEQDVQCIQLAYCARNESAPTTELKKCQCRDEFLDNDGTCSSGVQIMISIYLAILAAIVLQNNQNLQI